MKAYLYYLLFCVFFLYPLNGDDQWSKLLHNIDGENQIISSEFFLSNSINPSTKIELKATLQLLNSKVGKNVACNFPARYIYLFENDYDIPSFDLKKCKTLQNFKKEFSKENVSLVFSSEYVNSPASAFGHTMLLFWDNNKSIELGDSVHYAAQTPSNEDFLTYAYKGSSGKYKGYFIREPFFKKIYQYNTLEQRYMYIYNLNFTQKQIDMLIYHLFELRKATFKYYFLDENCATNTTDLLSVVTPNIQRKKSIYYLPIDTVNEFKEYIGSQKRYIPLINKLNYLVSKMSKDEKNLFFTTIKKKSEITKDAPDIVKEALSDYTTFYFRRFRRSYKNYENIMSQSYSKQNFIDTTPDPLLQTQPSLLRVGIYNDSEQFNYFSFRSLFSELTDIQYNTMQQSSVNIFSFDMIDKQNSTKLMKFNLLDLKSYTAQSDYYKPMSWSLYMGAIRETSKKDLNIITELGLGKTIISEPIDYLNTMFHIGLENERIYIKPSFSLSNLYKNFKFGIDNEIKYGDVENNHLQTKIYTTLKNKSIIYHLQYHKISKEDEIYMFSIGYNF